MYAMEFETLCVSEANGPLYVFLSSFGITKSLKWLLRAALSGQKETDACNPSTQEGRRIENLKATCVKY